MKWIHPKQVGVAAPVQMAMVLSFLFYCKQYRHISKWCNACNEFYTVSQKISLLYLTI